MNTIRSVSFIFLCGMLFSPVRAETPVIEDEHTVYPLSAFVFLEAQVEEGRYMSVDPGTAGFVTYDGGVLPQSANPGEVRMLTFRQKFRISGSLKGRDMYLIFGPLEYPMNIYLNGTIVERIGNYRGRYESIIFSSRKTLLSHYLLNWDGENEIGFEIFPIHDRVPMKNLFITGYANAARITFTRSLLNHRFEQYIVSISLFISVFFMFLYVSTRFQFRKYAIFAILALCFALGYFNFFIDEGADEVLLLKISRIGLLLVSGFLGLYIVEITGIFRKKWFILPYSVSTMVASPSILLFMGDKHGINSTFTFISNFTITPILVMSIVLVTISILKHRKKENLPLLVSLIVIAYCGIHDLGYLSAGDLPYVWLVIYGYFLLLLVIFFQLSIEQSNIYFSSVAKERQLNEKNGSMSRILRDIGEVTTTLSKNSKLLESSIMQASEITTQYQRINHEVKTGILTQLSGIDRIITAFTQRIRDFTSRMPRAIGNQNVAIESTSQNIGNMNHHIDEILSHTTRANEVAETLYELSSKSSVIVDDSRETIEKISVQSQFINEMMGAIEDISEKTNILSINASIESARAGSYGKGFSVVAGEIRNLAHQSKRNLQDSFEKLKEMFRNIHESFTLSGEISARLKEILERSRTSSSMMSDIQNLLREQKTESSSIMASTSSLLHESRGMLQLTEEEKAENEKVTANLRDLVGIFESITELLNAQEKNESRFMESMETIRSVLNENLKSIDILTSLQSTDGITPPTDGAGNRTPG